MVLPSTHSLCFPLTLLIPVQIPHRNQPFGTVLHVGGNHFWAVAPQPLDPKKDLSDSALETLNVLAEAKTGKTDASSELRVLQ